MSSFEVNPHTLRAAARAFTAAGTGLDHPISRFQSQAARAGVATGDDAAARGYEPLFDAHLAALRNLQTSLGRIAETLLSAALRYDGTEEDVVITGVEQP